MSKYRKVVESLEEFVKNASTKQVFNDPHIKTAEDRDLYEKGYIFGRGMAEGFLSKIAEEVPETLPTPAPAEPTVAPQQVPAEPADSDLEQLKQLMKQMTPAELAEWLLKQDSDVLAVIASDPELAAYANEALSVLDSMQEDAVKEEVSEKVEEEEEENEAEG